MESVHPLLPTHTGQSLAGLISCGRIAFGGGRLHHLRSGKRREQLLRIAVEGGIRVFDVAPAYGNGLCERALGAGFVSGQPSASINTKVGIPIAIYPRIADRMFPVFRAIDMVMGTSARAYGRRDFRTSTLVDSLEQSLRRLRVSSIETYFLHEPLAMLSGSQLDAVVETMGRLRSSGKIGSWGISGPSRGLNLELLKSDVPFVLQHPMDEIDDVLPPSFSTKRLVFSTYAAFKKSTTKGSFSDFLQKAALRHPNTTFIVSTLNSARLSSWLGKTQP